MALSDEFQFFFPPVTFGAFALLLLLGKLASEASIGVLYTKKQESSGGQPKAPRFAIVFFPSQYSVLESKTDTSFVPTAATNLYITAFLGMMSGAHSFGSLTDGHEPHNLEL